ncbi:MAG: VacJ family lipoprotein [Gammaproteobacteria bacterium]|nr:VacJ family lipoprotein [Gammaproteobacteria bacterium]
MTILTACAFLVALASVARAADESGDGDPWQGYNRAVFEFNDTIDRAVLKPVAEGYQDITPGIIRSSIGNFFGNLDDVDNAVNNSLQGKLGAGLSDVGRVLVNSTLGVGGLFDIASELGLEKHEEDFGQTLAVWGAPRGPYFVLPFMGPSTVTETLGRPVGSYLDPLRYYEPVHHRNLLFGLRFVDDREGLLSSERLVSGDRYIFIRDAYLQRRQYLIDDGSTIDPFADF